MRRFLFVTMLVFIGPFMGGGAERETAARRFGAFVDENGIERIFRRGVVLAKEKGGRFHAAPTAVGQELASLRALRSRAATEFAELDLVMDRQFLPSDPGVGGQWHHAKIGSTNAWAISIGYNEARRPLVSLAIMDSPFQMNHPDLERNSTIGWSLLTRSPNAYTTNGYYHSTIAAGMAGAVINNETGVSGMANCLLTPVDIGNLPTTRDMHDAVIWAADNGIRVVNLSWDGAFSAVINEAGQYLKEKARGMLFMAGVNGAKFLNYPAMPHIYAVAMTDINDQARSAWGDHIDFAAPGWDIYSTTTNSTYEADSGTSYSAPLMAGVAAWIMSANPELGPAEIEEILRQSCVDLGTPGWDQRFGWGRIDFGRAARLTFERSPISHIAADANGAEAVHELGTSYRLFRSSEVEGVWSVVNDPIAKIGDGRIHLRDPSPPSGAAFYRIEITRPH